VTKLLKPPAKTVMVRMLKAHWSHNSVFSADILFNNVFLTFCAFTATCLMSKSLSVNRCCGISKKISITLEEKYGQNAPLGIAQSTQIVVFLNEINLSEHKIGKN